MSQLDLVRATYAAFARGDLPSVLAAFAPDVRWRTPATLPWSRGDYFGHAGMLDYFDSFARHLDGPAIVPRELLEAGDRVIALGVEQGRARSTGVAFSAEFAHIWTLRDGRAVEMQGIIDTAVVRRAFGLDAMKAADA